MIRIPRSLCCFSQLFFKKLLILCGIFRIIELQTGTKRFIKNQVHGKDLKV
nr:MAG TPA: hypothetical protein [Caudoviricetes sp.]